MADPTNPQDQAPQEEGELHRGQRGNPPDYDAFHVREGSNGKNYWNRVGVAYRHGDNKGLTVDLESVPVDGKVTLRERAEQLAQKRDASPAANPQNAPERSHEPQR